MRLFQYPTQWSTVPNNLWQIHGNLREIFIRMATQNSQLPTHNSQLTTQKLTTLNLLVQIGPFYQLSLKMLLFFAFL